jgi:hypothetical protein
MQSKKHLNKLTPDTRPVFSVDMMEMFMKHQVELVKTQTEHSAEIQKSQQIQHTEMFKVLADRVAPQLVVPTNHHQNVMLEQTNINSHNKKFNLNFFLNEECKNAMNISDFIKNVIVTMEDLEHIGKVGYTEGMSNILSKALSEKEHTERPLHCTDVKRETIYVRKNDAWEKDTDKEETKRLIQHIAHKNYKALAEWRGEHPEYDTADSGDYEAWYRISRNICNTDPAALNKLVRHLAMSTAVEKSEATNVLL